jgi:hypothetical protein
MCLAENVITKGWPPVAAGAGDGFHGSAQGIEAQTVPQKRFPAKASGLRPALSRVEHGLGLVQRNSSTRCRSRPPAISGRVIFDTISEGIILACFERR